MLGGEVRIELVIRKITPHKVVLSYDPNDKEEAMKIRRKRFPGRKIASAKALRQKGLEEFHRPEEARAAEAFGKEESRTGEVRRAGRPRAPLTGEV